MVYHDNTFGTLASAQVKQTKVEVVSQTQDPYGFYDGALVYHANSVAGNLVSVTIDSVGVFLGTVTKKATVKLNVIDASATIGQIFKIKLGIYNNDPSVSGFDTISVGFFLVDNVAFDYETNSTTITMYDWMWKAANTPYATGFAYPCTVQSLAGQVSSALGVSLMTGFSTLPNYNYTITEDLYADISNATLQTVIQEIAAATGTTARITDTTLNFVKFSPSNEVLNSDTLIELKVGDAYGPVTSVILGRVPQNDNIVLNNKVSVSNLITSINTTTNLFTITGSGMPNGTLVHLTSTATLPAPLTAGTNYFVFTNGSANTFALTATYADAIAGTNLIDITTSGSGTISLASLTTQEVQINNVQILDNDRVTLLPSLYNSLLGVYWNKSTSKTIGLGWHEVGDVISYQQGSTIVRSFLSEVHLTLDGAISESLVSTIPTAETINYQTAGGILKTIYNTEIKVDKQNQDIESIVSQQLDYETSTQNNFTDVYQTINGVVTTIQSAGGGNFIINSVGRAKNPDTTLTAWTHSGTGAIASDSSAGSLAVGATSGYVIILAGSSAKITQTQPISVATTKAYSLGFRVNKLAGDGSARVTLTNSVTTYYIDILNAVGYAWQELVLENIIPGQNIWNVTVEVTSPTTKIEITDLRVLLGATISPWVQSHDEILNTQVALTTEGIRVTSSANQGGDYTVMTPIEFKGYSNISGTSQPVFWLNRDTTRTQKVSVAEGIEYGKSVNGVGGIIRSIVIASGPNQGLAFVGAVS
jgi:hypothetical protein